MNPRSNNYSATHNTMKTFFPLRLCASAVNPSP